MDQDPYAEGADAFIKGQPETANPYDPNDAADAHCSWNDGWSNAQQARDEADTERLWGV